MSPYLRVGFALESGLSGQTHDERVTKTKTKTNQPTIDHPSIQPSGKSNIVEDQLKNTFKKHTAHDASDVGNSRNRPEPFGTVLD